jgi:hypothetical protein
MPRQQVCQRCFSGAYISFYSNEVILHNQ